MNKQFTNLSFLLKKAVKKSKQLSYSVAVLITLLMNGNLIEANTINVEKESSGYKFLRNYSYDYDDVDHSWQIGANYYFNRYHIGKVGDRIEITRKSDDIITPNEKFNRYRYPNDLDERYKNDNSSVKIEKEEENNFKFFTTFKPVIDSIKELEVEAVRPEPKLILTDTPVALFPFVEEKEIELMELPKLRPTEIGYNEVPAYMVGFGKKKRGYFNEDVFIESIGKVSPSFEGNYYIEGSPHYNYVKALENKAGNNSDKGRYIEKYEKLNGGLISQLDLVSGEYNLLFKGYEKVALIDDYEFTYDESKDRVLKRIEKDKKLTKEEREKKKAEYIEKQKKAVEKYNSKARKKEYAYEFNIKSASFTPTDEITDTTFPEEYRGSLYAESFYRHSGKELSNISKDVNINVVGKLGKKAEKETEDRPINSIFYLGNPNLKEYLVNKDFGIEGEDPTKLKKNYHNITDHQKFMEGEKIVVTKKVNTEASKLVTEANINLYGEGIIVANIDNVHSIGDTHFENQGTIIGHNDRGTFKGETGEIEGNEANKHIFGGFSYGDFGNDIIENGKNGKVLFYAPNSVGWSYSSGNTQNIVRHAINKGEFKLYGKNSIGIGFVNPPNKKENYDPHQVSFANIQLENPIEILGDNSIGIDFSKPFYSKDKKETVDYKVIKLEDVLNRNTSSLKNETGVNMPYSLLNMELDLNYNYSVYNYIVTHLTKKDDGNWYYKFNDAKAEGIISVTPKVDKKTANNSNKPEGFYDKNDSINTYRDGKAEVDEATFKFYSLNGTLLEVKNKKVVYPETTSPLYDSKLNIKIGGLADKLQDNGGDILGSTDKVQNSVGLNFNFDEKDPNIKDTDNREITNYKIELADDTENSTAIRVGNADIKFSENDYTSIKLGGENNIAFLSDGLVDYTLKDDGSVEKKDVDNTIKMGAMGLIYNNTLHKIENTGKNNIIFLGRREGKLYIENKFESNLSGDGLTLALAVGNEVEGVDDATKETKIHFKKGIEGEIAGKDVVAFYSKKGYIKIDAEDPSVSITPTETDGHIKDSSLPEKKLVISGTAGIGAYAKDGVIEAEKVYIKLEDGATGLYSKGEKANLKITDSIIDYNGNGYAVYSENDGKLDLSNSTVILRGRAIGYDDSHSNNLTLTGTKFVAMSNSIYAKTVKDKGRIKLSTLVDDLGLAGITIIPGEKDGEIFDKYRDAYVNGVEEFLIDIDADKKVALDDNNKDENVYKWFRKYAFQKANLVLAENKSVEAYLTASDIEKLGKISLTGLDVSSSDTANSIDKTSILLKPNSEVRADRTDDGTGAIGLFVNYGKITTEEGSKVTVEKSGINEENSEAVGIYAVNGSVVENRGDVTVGGKNSVGMLGLSYRINPAGEPQKREFFGKAGSGTISLVNKGTLTLENENGVGIFLENNKDLTDNSETKAVNEGRILLSGIDSIGMVSKGGTLENKGEITLTGEHSYGVVVDVNSKFTNETDGIIRVNTPNSDKKNAGIVKIDDESEITHKGRIEIEKSGYGIYTDSVNVEGGTIKIGEKSAGIFSRPRKDSKNRQIILDRTSKIEGGNGNAAIYVAESNDGEEKQEVIISGAHSIELGENSFSYLIKSRNTLMMSNTPEVELKNKSMHIYSEAVDGVITNNTKINITGDNGFGIRAAGRVDNNGDIDMSSGKASIALHALDGGVIYNGSENGSKPIIKTGTSDVENQFYSIGMAGGSSDGLRNGAVINYGTIEALNDYNVGMYASGNGSVAINKGTIKLSGRNTLGMYITNGAIGENYGLIESVVTSGVENRGIIGAFADKKSVFKNYGTIRISGENNRGIIFNDADAKNVEGTGIIEATGGAEDLEDQLKPKNKDETAINSDVSAGSVSVTDIGDSEFPTIKVNEKEVPSIKINTLTPDEQDFKVTVADVVKEIPEFDPKKKENDTFAADLGLYIDTSGIKFTKPIEGLENLQELPKIELIFGMEATKYTGAKAVAVGNNILAPYNKMIKDIVNKSKGNIEHFSTSASSLTWILAAKMNKETQEFETVYLVKLPYTDFSTGDVNTDVVLQAMENRYGKSTLTARERELFYKFNGIGKGEVDLFLQSVRELRGNQYATTTRRLKESKLVFDTEFDSLYNWKSRTKDTTKVKVFGEKTRYRPDNVDLVGYSRNVKGVYLMDDTVITDREKEGTFFGFGEENYGFYDFGKSTEKALNTQLGYYKGTIYGEDKNVSHLMKVGVEGSYRKLSRKFKIADEIFGANANYFGYGIFVDNEISQRHDISENMVLDTKFGFDLGYVGTYRIKEKSGEMRVKLPRNDSFRITPKLVFDLKQSQAIDKGRLYLSSKLELSNDFGYVLENPRRVQILDSDTGKYKLAKDRNKLSLKITETLSIEKENIGGHLRVGYDFLKREFNLGFEFRFKLDNDNKEKEKLVEKVDENIKVDENLKNDENIKIDENVNIKENEKLIEKVDENVNIDEKTEVDESIKEENIENKNIEVEQSIKAD